VSIGTTAVGGRLYIVNQIAQFDEEKLEKVPPQ
jgi:hypothetical protein